MGAITKWPGRDVVLSTGHLIHERRAAAGADKPAAVMVHGLGGSSSNWTLLMSELSGEFDQWAPDLPGFGDSPPSGDHTVQAYVADVTAYLERFDTPVHLLGNSMGGLISLLVASARPDLVRTLTLLSPAMPQYLLPWGAQATAVMAAPKLGEWILGRVNDEPSQEQIERMAPMMYGEPDNLDPDEFAFAVRERMRWVRQPHADDVLLGALRSLVAQYLAPHRRSPWWAARKVLCPTMVVVSERDALVGSWVARRWCRTMPGARVVKLERTGHVAMMEHPRAVAGLVRAFLRDVSNSRDDVSTKRAVPAGMRRPVAPLRVES
ncbi:alpha/beta fold hydrolase [Phytoactinopolyspora halotolerans]|uniref:Alpha/beta hydrolase n=1 Tax=Phytoactinopolyspora halotolerans TaxID=1981512 RepID=A0A6L9SHI8_9ACTN|nr:alpha/beta hydrolase [Phytoactinopolyspora halotolerans]NEE04124.1 alpha/beta hydrolase [Phytoactinopolyspora halotolerans]